LEGKADKFLNISGGFPVLPSAFSYLNISNAYKEQGLWIYRAKAFNINIDEVSREFSPMALKLLIFNERVSSYWP